MKNYAVLIVSLLAFLLFLCWMGFLDQWTEIPVRPGQVWVPDGNVSPFEKQDQRRYIIDVRDGWVKYRWIEAPDTFETSFSEYKWHVIMQPQNP